MMNAARQLGALMREREEWGDWERSLRRREQTDGNRPLIPDFPPTGQKSNLLTVCNSCTNFYENPLTLIMRCYLSGSFRLQPSLASYPLLLCTSGTMKLA